MSVSSELEDYIKKFQRLVQPQVDALNDKILRGIALNPGKCTEAELEVLRQRLVVAWIPEEITTGKTGASHTRSKATVAGTTPLGESNRENSMGPKFRVPSTIDIRYPDDDFRPDPLNTSTPNSCARHTATRQCRPNATIEGDDKDSQISEIDPSSAAVAKAPGHSHTYTQSELDNKTRCTRRTQRKESAYRALNNDLAPFLDLQREYYDAETASIELRNELNDMVTGTVRESFAACTEELDCIAEELGVTRENGPQWERLSGSALIAPYELLKSQKFGFLGHGDGKGVDWDRYQTRRFLKSLASAVETASKYKTVGERFQGRKKAAEKRRKAKTVVVDSGSDSE